MHIKTLIFFISALLISAASTNAAIVNFDGLSHGEVLSTQFQASHGLTFSAINSGTGPHGNHPDKLVIFDTMLTDTRDPDLEFPWRGGNLNVDVDPNPATSGDVKLYKVFAIAENDVDGDGNGLIDNPDDEAGGGTIILQWNHDLLDISFAQLDMDESTVNQIVELYDDGGLVLSKSFQQLFGSTPGVTFAHHYANQLPSLQSVASFEQFDEMRLILTGSGAFDIISTEVPEPTTMGLLVVGGLVFLKRRKK